MAVLQVAPPRTLHVLGGLPVRDNTVAFQPHGEVERRQMAMVGHPSCDAAELPATEDHAVKVVGGHHAAGGAISCPDHGVTPAATKTTARNLWTLDHPLSRTQLTRPTL